ncbi:hypothetical protein SAMN04487911_10311 [Arenibacter nanhaiticus]|uniref:Tetracyclin repressor-like C-terminal domain-containing protein n=1 Tax=Arenibacter nanhaiticus TaxID=558155 RepID=A0A1M6BY26_9FLAO|nr:TetR family transcriptional regulator C-terminal domain-containing protein [Arenibacter nanhaiticus]SHI53424.1 hypothetical protein SAMN04487911_10311 [Arenibacter nanhaiticus]
MAKNKTITPKDLVTWYMDYVLEHNEKPKSVYAFAKAHNFEEQKFYQFFGSFEALEKDVFKTFHEVTLQVLEKSEDYNSFDARNKLLSYYFTFFENLTANRSYVKASLERYKNGLKGLSVLSSLRECFIQYIDVLDIETLELKQEKIEKIQKKALSEGAWLQFLLTIKFWMGDTSAGFEKTDVFIEKSVNTSFDVLNIAPLKSLVDFGKFIFKEKSHFNL